MGFSFLQSHLAELSSSLGSPSLSVSTGPAGPLLPAPKAALPSAFSQPPALEEELRGRKHLFVQAVSGLVS